MKNRVIGLSAAHGRQALLVLDSLPPELECNFDHFEPRLVLSVNDPMSLQVTHGEAAAPEPDQEIVQQETERWLERMLHFYPRALSPLLRCVGRRAARHHVKLMRQLAAEHESIYYVSWGYKDLSVSIARHFVPAERCIELENGFFRRSCLSVTNKPLLRQLGVDTLFRGAARRRMGSRFKLLHPQFWEDCVTYHQTIKRRLLMLSRRKSPMPDAANHADRFDVLLALQLDFDSATIQNGCGWNSLELLRFVKSTVRPNRVLVRTHPFEKSAKVRQIRRLAKRYGFVFSNSTLEQDMASTHCVLTINSSVIGDCLASRLPFFYAGIIPEELRTYGRPIEELPAALAKNLAISGCQALPDNFDPAELLEHVAVQDACASDAHAAVNYRS